MTFAIATVTSSASRNAITQRSVHAKSAGGGVTISSCASVGRRGCARDGDEVLGVRVEERLQRRGVVSGELHRAEVVGW